MPQVAVESPRVEVRFPGGARVEAHYRGHTVLTDQPVEAGGGGTAVSPFDLFLASIATCAGFYAQRFCQSRKLSTDGLALSLEALRDPERKRVERVVLHLTLPEGFPDRYRLAITRAVDQCAVKRHLAEPPSVELHLR